MTYEIFRVNHLQWLHIQIMKVAQCYNNYKQTSSAVSLWKRSRFNY